MGFGALAPCPIRLGGTPEDGLTASQHARLCEHLVSLSNTGELCVVTVSFSDASATATAIGYYGRNGTGLQNAPLVSYDGTYIKIDLSSYVNSLGFEVDLARYATHGCAMECTVQGTGERIFGVFDYEKYVAQFIPSRGSDAIFVVSIYGSEPIVIGAFDGHLQKKDSVAEGDETYAATWYGILKDAQGSAYTKSDTSVRAWETLAEARAFGSSQRISEMLAASGTPGGSDALLGRWAELLGVQQGALPPWEIRLACERNFVGLNPVTDDSLSTGLTERLGSMFLRIEGIANVDFEAWPSATYWPGVIPGDNAYSLDGTGNWSASRARVNIVMDAGGESVDELIAAFNKDAFDYLRGSMSATSIAEPCESVGGFIIGTSRIGAAAI